MDSTPSGILSMLEQLCCRYGTSEKGLKRDLVAVSTLMKARTVASNSFCFSTSWPYPGIYPRSVRTALLRQDDICLSLFLRCNTLQGFQELNGTVSNPYAYTALQRNRKRGHRQLRQSNYCITPQSFDKSTYPTPIVRP